MFSPNCSEPSKLIDMCFLAGLTNHNIIALLNNNRPSNSDILNPDVLLTIPNQKQLIIPSVLKFIFPEGLRLSFSEEKPKFYAIVLTNEKGKRTYVYILKLFERITNLEMNDDHYGKDLINRLSLSATSNNNNTFEIKSLHHSIYVPLAVCLWSSLSNTEFFHDLLCEIYHVINCRIPDDKLPLNLNTDGHIIRDYQICELLSYFNFLVNLVKPPSFTNLADFSRINFYFSSEYEIPRSDFNIKLLFNVLEISVIIKLWVSILIEKQIILISNQNLLLFAVCEAMMNLIYPFKWLHTYIPILSHSEMDYLESPTPYIMGVNSNFTDYYLLKKLFPNHVICDINTCQIYSNSTCNLPTLEETTLRKKLIHLKNPEMFNIEEVSLFTSESDNLQIEDILKNRNFTQNVQYSFFRIFRTNLNKLKDIYFKKKVLGPKNFLEDTEEKEFTELWYKIINTVAFEYFILSDQYFDSNIEKFNVINNEEKYTNQDDAYYCEINVPSSIDNLYCIDCIQENGLNDSHQAKTDFWKKCSLNYANVLNELQCVSPSNKLRINKDCLGLWKRNDKLKKHSKKNSQYSSTFHIGTENIFHQKDNSILTTNTNNITKLSIYGVNGLLNFYQNNLSDLRISELDIKYKKRCELNSILNSNTYIKRNYFEQLPILDTYQYFLLLAFYLEEFPNSRDFCFELYIKAYNYDNHSFPRIRFLQFLNNYEYEQLKELKRKTSIQLLNKIIEYKINHTLLNKKNNNHGQQDDDFNYITDFNEDLNLVANNSKHLSNTSDKKSYVENDSYSNSNNALKIIENLKSDVKVKNYNIINNYNWVLKIDLDPLSICEDLTIKLFTFVKKNSLDKFKSDLLTSKLLSDLTNTVHFNDIKYVVALLQGVNLNKFSSAESKLCFWLNLYNFLAIFTIIYNKKVLSNYYEWYNFFRNNYYNIGGHELSLYDIENCIFSKCRNSENIYKEKINFSDTKYFSQLEELEQQMNFGISIPTKSSPQLKIYFPNTLKDSLKLNASEYLSKNIDIDVEQNILKVAEYIIWTDKNFLDNLEKYVEILSTDFVDFMKVIDKQFSLHILKYEWNLYFGNLQ